MLQDHRQQFGVDLAQDAPGFVAAPLIQARILLPQFEEQLDLPASSQQGQGLREGESGSWYIGHDQRPVRQQQRSLTALLCCWA